MGSIPEAACPHERTCFLTSDLEAIPEYILHVVSETVETHMGSRVRSVSGILKSEVEDTGKESPRFLLWLGVIETSVLPREP